MYLWLEYNYPSANCFSFYPSGCGLINKRLLELSDDDVIDALFALGPQQAHRVLGHDLSYKGFLKRTRAPRARARPRRIRRELPDEELEQLWGRERLERAEERAEMADEGDKRKSMKEIQAEKERARLKEQRRKERELARAQSKDKDPEANDPKRQRVSRQPPRAPQQPRGSRVEKTVSGDKGPATPLPPSEPQAQNLEQTVVRGNRDDSGPRVVARGSGSASALEPWAPTFESPKGKLCRTASVRKDPKIAATLLRGVALPKDMEVVNAASMEENLIELHSLSAKV